MIPWSVAVICPAELQTHLPLAAPSLWLVAGVTATPPAGTYRPILAWANIAERISRRDFNYFGRVAVWRFDCKLLWMANVSPSDRDSNKFKTRLEARISELECGLGRDFIAVEQSADQLDEIQQTSERTLVISNLDRSSQQLGDARAALRRIAEGSFGVCLECGDHIHPRVFSQYPGLRFASIARFDHQYQYVQKSTNKLFSTLGLRRREHAQLGRNKAVRLAA